MKLIFAYISIMAGNTIGRILRLASFGESHGKLIGGVLEGFPSGLSINLEALEKAMQRRAPGSGIASSPRNEADKVEIVSGVFEGRTTGAPIAFFIENSSHKSSDYEHLKDVYRPSHSSFTYEHKYGNYDHRGGGRSSARETAVRVAAGSLCQQLLEQYGVTIIGYVSQVGTVALNIPYHQLDFQNIENSEIRCPDKDTEIRMLHYLEEIKEQGDSVGGIVSCVIKGVPPGIGDPVYERLQAILGMYMLSINAVKGFEYGEGFRSASMKGSEHNDSFTFENDLVHPLTNHAGGILAGISTGEDIFFRVAFKPVSSIKRSMDTVDKLGNAIKIETGGRHDVCIVPRAVAVVEAMASLAIADCMLLSGKIPGNLS